MKIFQSNTTNTLTTHRKIKVKAGRAVRTLGHQAAAGLSGSDARTVVGDHNATRAGLSGGHIGAVVYDLDGSGAGDGGGHIALLGARDVGVAGDDWLDGAGELGGVADVGVSIAVSGHGHSASASVVDPDVAVAVLGGSDTRTVVDHGYLAGAVLDDSHEAAVVHDEHGSTASDGGGHIARLGAGDVGVGGGQRVAVGVSWLG